MTTKIIKANIATLTKTEIETTLANDSICLASWSVGSYNYQLVQSATDNNIKIVRIDSLDAYTTITITVAYNTATSFFPQYTQDGYYAYITASTGYIHRVNLTTFLEDGKMYRSALDTTGTITTITDNFNDSGVIETIDTGSFADDKTGRIRLEIIGE